MLAALTLAIVLSSLAAGCFTDVPTSSGVETITIIAGKAGVSLNPYTNVLSTRQVGALLFRGVLGVDSAGMPSPDLALEVPTRENGGIDASGTTITYRLDPDAEWADGTPLTAQDVVFTWDLIAAGLLTDDPRGIENVRDVTAVDEEIVRVTLAQPDAPFVWHFVPYVLPQHLLADSPDLLSDDFWVHAVGSRGRVVARNVKATQVDLVDPEGASPTLRVVFTETDEGGRTVWQSVDRCVWLNPPVGPTGAEQISSVPGNRWQAFVMNPSEGRPTADLAAREAFSAVTTVTVTPGTTGPFGLPTTVPVYPKSEITGALDAAGWKPGADGVRYKQGRSLTFSVLFNPISADEGDRIEYVIGEAIKGLGGAVEPNASFPFTDYTGGSRISLGRFDVALLEFPIGAPYGWAWPFASEDVPSESNPAGLNVARISDPDLDAAYAAMRQAGNTGELQSALGAAWARLESQRYVLWDRQIEQTVLYKGLEGVEAEPLEEYALRAADTWRIVGAPTGE